MGRLERTEFGSSLQLLLMQAEKYFKAATLQFYQGDLHQALDSLDRSLKLRPSALALNNRALVHFHMGSSGLAQMDLEAATTLSPLNYLTHFNLAALHLRQQRNRLAVDSLTIALSCLHLILGRHRKSSSDVLLALQLCSNNFEALVLLTLLEVRVGNYQSAAETVGRYAVQQENSKHLAKIHSKLKDMAQHYNIELETGLYELLEGLPARSSPLVPTSLEYPSESQQLEKLVAEKLEQFNKLFAEVSQLFAGTTRFLEKPSHQFVFPVTNLRQEQPPSLIRPLVTTH